MVKSIAKLHNFPSGFCGMLCTIDGYLYFE